VLLLRAVLGFSAPETAEVLSTGVAGVTSALHRARGALEPHRASGRRGRQHRGVGDEAEARLLERYVAAWHANDVRALLALLRRDALLTMAAFPADDGGGKTAYGIMVLTVASSRSPASPTGPVHLLRSAATPGELTWPTTSNSPNGSARPSQTSVSP
jgi:Sigma-70, region 4